MPAFSAATCARVAPRYSAWSSPMSQITETAGTRFNSDGGLMILAGTLNNAGQTVVLGGSGDTWVSGAITNTGAISKDGTGRLTLSGTNRFGATSASAGTLALDFSAANAPFTNIVPQTSALTLNNAALQMISSGSVNTQQFASTALSSGLIRIGATNSPGGEARLVLGALTRANAAAVDFALPAVGAITTTTSTNAAGLLGAGATVGGTDWASTTSAASCAPGSSPSTGVRNTMQMAPAGSARDGRAANADATASRIADQRQDRSRLVIDPPPAPSSDCWSPAGAKKFATSFPDRQGAPR